MNEDRARPPRRVALVGLMTIRVMRVVIFGIAGLAVMTLLSCVWPGLPMPSWLERVPAESVSFNLIFGFLALFVMGAFVKMLALLQGVIESVMDGRPFQERNADRLQGIGWWLVAVQCDHGLVFAIERIWQPYGEKPSILVLPFTGIAAIIIVFILAWVFRVGAQMREELDQVV